MNRDVNYYNPPGIQGDDRWVVRVAVNLKDLCVLYVIAWVVVPILASKLIFRTLALACCGVFLVCIYPKIRNAILGYLVCAFSLISLLFMIIWLGQGDLEFAISRVINLFVIIALGLFSIYYYRYEQKKLKIFFYYVITLFVLVAIPSLIALQNNEYVMRNASGLTERTGIEVHAGSYGYVYGCVFLETILVYDLRNNKYQFWTKVMLLAVTVFIGYLILNAGYTTAVILTLLGVIMSLSVRKSGVITLVLFGLIGIILLAITPTLLEYIFKNFDIPLVYKQKLAILVDMTDSDTSMTYTDSTRGELLVQSLEAVIQYPLIGSVLWAGKHAAGGHQVLVDVLANYGIMYALLYYYVVVHTASRQLKSDPKLKLTVSLLLLALGFTNTYDYTTFVVPLLVGPYIAVKQGTVNSK